MNELTAMLTAMLFGVVSIVVMFALPEAVGAVAVVAVYVGYRGGQRDGRRAMVDRARTVLDKLADEPDPDLALGEQLLREAAEGKQ